MKRPTKCPLCGGQIIKVTNAVTKNSYYKCSNEKCHFVLGETYTEAEFYLQGKSLKTICLKCHTPLTIANGPHGLYARCFECSCDSEPTSYNGKVYYKWANTHKAGVKDEIKNLIHAFEAENVEDELYDFETYIALNQSKEKEVKETPTRYGAEEEITPVKTETKAETTLEKVLSVVESDIKKTFTAHSVASKLNIDDTLARNTLARLKSLNLVKVVHYLPSKKDSRFLFMRYQAIEGPGTEIRLYFTGEGYDSAYSFCKEKKKTIMTSEVIKYLSDNNIKWVPLRKSKGICKGYSETDLSNALNYVTYGSTKSKQLELPMTPQKSAETSDKKTIQTVNKGDIKSQIISTLQSDLNKSYTTKQLAEVLSLDGSSVKNVLKILKNEKMVKIVGWAPEKRRQGATALKYQLVESSLPKFKVTVDNNLYSTVGQFFKKRLKNKKTLSLKEAMEKVENLESIPLIINQKAFIGYPVATLRETFKDYMTTPVSKTRKKVANVSSKRVKKEASTPEEIQAAVLVSNPVQKKSFLSMFSSIFKNKEKVHS